MIHIIVKPPLATVAATVVDSVHTIQMTNL